MNRSDMPFSENALITPEMARRLLDSMDGNRPKSKSRWEIYAADMRNGKWDMNGESIKIDKNGRMIDGQHRMLAVIAADRPVWFTIMRNIEPKTFATIDSGQSRTTGQVFSIKNIKNANTTGSIVCRVEELREKQKITGGGRRVKAYGSNRDILAKYETDPEGYDKAAEVAQAMYKKMRIFTPTFVGAIYYYLTHNLGYQAAFVEDFLACMHTLGTTHIKQADKLKEHLIKKRLVTGTKLSTEYAYNIFAKVWNKYVDGQSIKRLNYAPDVEGDIRLMYNPNRKR